MDSDKRWHSDPKATPPESQTSETLTIAQPLYPVQRTVSPKKRDQEDLAKMEQPEAKSRRRSSILSISLKQPDQIRRWSAGDLIKNWRAISIEATVEKELAVEKLDSILKNLELGIYDQAKQARKLGIKSMWLFLVVVMHGVLVYEVTQRTIQYYYNPVITTFTLRTPKAIDFPQVYVCMAASANRTFMLQHPKEFALSNYFRERVVGRRRKRAVVPRSQHSNVISIPEMHEYLAMHDSLLNRVRRGANYTNGDIFDVYRFFYDAGYHVDETFLECSFYGSTEKKLPCKDIIEPILDINYGLCYVVKVDGLKQSNTRGGKSMHVVFDLEGEDVRA